MNRISAELEQYIIPKNRTGNLIVSNEITLPVSLEDCLINADESYQATSTTINKSLSGLYTNFLYLYSRCFLLENNFPTNNPTYIGVRQSDIPSTLTIEDINNSSTTTLLNALNSVSFTVNRFVENYLVTIPLSTAATPPLTAAKDLAYTYVDVLTSLPNNLFDGETPLESSGSYTVTLTGKPSIALNDNFSTNPSNIFLTTSTFDTNNGELNLTESSNSDLFTKFSFYSSLSAGVDDLVDMQVGYNYYSNKQVIICASKTRIFIFTDNNNVFELVYSSNTVGYKRDIAFVSISSILINGTTLYVTDSYYNNVYKLDASGFLNDNHVNSNRLVVDHIIGGTGTGSDITQFSYPELQFIHEDKIYIFDRNNKFIKIYDLSLNFISSINLSTLFKQYPCIQTLRPFNKNVQNGILDIFILSTYTVIDKQLSYTINSIIVLNSTTFSPVKIVNLTFNNSLENLRCCLQSINNTDISYIVTNFGQYKFNNTNFSQIGYFTTSIGNNKYIALLSLNNEDLVYMYSTPGYGIFTRYVESSTYASLLTNIDFNIYSLDEVSINQNENQTFFVYNKAFKKIFYNYHKLLTNIAFRPSYNLQIGTSLNTRVFQGLKYLDNTTYENLQVVESKDFYIGENEIFCNSVINRVITKFYSILELALNSISNDVVINFNTISLPSTKTNTGTYIMTELYDPTISSTYNSVILTEDGRGIVLENAQGVSSLPPHTIGGDTQVVDNNVVIILPPSIPTTLTTPVLVNPSTPGTKLNDNIVIIPGTTITPMG